MTDAAIPGVRSSSKRVRFDVASSNGTFLGNLLLYIYIVLVILKKIFSFDDGLVDIVLLSLIAFVLALKPRQTFLSLKRICAVPTIIAAVVFTCFFLFLALKFHSNPKLTGIEFLSTFKWLIYYIMGLLVGFNCISNSNQLFGSRSFFVVGAVVFIYSISAYSWLGLFKYGLSFRSFYDNSFESIFMLRSVFALFGLALLLYCVNNRSDTLNALLIFFSLVFLYMAGNRKMLIALALMFFVIEFSHRHRLLLRWLKFSVVAGIILYLPTTDLYKKSMIEYTNVDQPRIFAYLKAFEIATDYFPLGSGPSTFASRGSMEDYSPVYQWYGLSNKYGFRPDDEEHFYNDTYWCQIIGQYGALGSVLVIAILLSMYRDFKTLNFRPSLRLRHEYILLLLILLSTSTPLFQRTEIALIIFFAYGYGIAKKNRLNINPLGRKCSLPIRY